MPEPGPKASRKASRKPSRKLSRRRRSRHKEQYECCCCRKKTSFCWTCECGLQICQECMQENLWGLTCNYVDWECPDCGVPKSAFEKI